MGRCKIFTNWVMEKCEVLNEIVNKVEKSNTKQKQQIKLYGRLSFVCLFKTDPLKNKQHNLKTIKTRGQSSKESY